LVELEVAMAVASTDRDAIPVSDAEVAKRANQPARPIPGLFVGQSVSPQRAAIRSGAT
jgi:hypothetical protein